MILKFILAISIATLFYFLFKVFSGSIILPQSFSLGPLTIHYYGLIMAAAVATGFYLAIKRSSSFGISAKQGEDLIFWLIIGGFIGARLYHVLSSFPYYYLHPADIIKVWNGGLSIYGSVLGGLIAIIIYKKLVTCHLSLVTVLDWLTPSLILGQIIGRFGNLFNYEAFGYPTNLPWKMFVPLNFRGENLINYQFFHPWFLYEAVGNLIILLFLLRVIEPKCIKKRSPGSYCPPRIYKYCFWRHSEGVRPTEESQNIRDSSDALGMTPRSARSYPGMLVFCYLLLYNSLRFGLEFLRTDSTFIGIFRLNAIMSLGLLVLALFGLGTVAECHFRQKSALLAKLLKKFLRLTKVKHQNLF